MLQGLLHIPNTSSPIFDLFQQQNVVPPRNFCNELLQNLGTVDLCHALWHFCRCFNLCHSLWHKSTINGILSVQRKHTLDVPFRKPLYLRQLVTDVPRQPGYDRSSPAFPVLSLMEHPADVPIHADQLCIGGKHGASLSLPDPLLDPAEQLSIHDYLFSHMDSS